MAADKIRARDRHAEGRARSRRRVDEVTAPSVAGRVRRAAGPPAAPRRAPHRHRDATSRAARRSRSRSGRASPRPGQNKLLILAEEYVERAADRSGRRPQGARRGAAEAREGPRGDRDDARAREPRRRRSSSRRTGSPRSSSCTATRRRRRCAPSRSGVPPPSPLAEEEEAGALDRSADRLP